MANAGTVTYTNGAPSTISNPAAGTAVHATDTANHPYTVSSSGVIWAPQPSAIMVADLAIANTDTVVQNLAVPLNAAGVSMLAVAGTTIRVEGSGSMVAGAAAASIFVVRGGVAGTTSDAALATFTLANSSTSGTTAFSFEIFLTLRTVGAGAGTATGTISIINNSTTLGIDTAATEVLTVTGSSLALTTPTFVSVTYKSGSASNTCTFKTCIVSIICP